MNRVAAAGLALALVALPAQAETIQGRARVVDGDSIEIRKRPIRLTAIDAPELSQTCQRDGKEWACGLVAAAQLRLLIKKRRVICQSEGLDRYGRWLAACKVADVDLGGEMVAAGLALAYRRYSSRYVTEENAARAAKQGLWAGEFDPPETWRRAHPF
ncbi:MAG: thermonuclease family protein [Rhodospirillales bacterium]|jgi:endonuclease YncB( thermonuclease family)